MDKEFLKKLHDDLGYLEQFLANQGRNWNSPQCEAIRFVLEGIEEMVRDQKVDENLG